MSFAKNFGKERDGDGGLFSFQLIQELIKIGLPLSLSFRHKLTEIEIYEGFIEVAIRDVVLVHDNSSPYIQLKSEAPKKYLPDPKPTQVSIVLDLYSPNLQVQTEFNGWDITFEQAKEGEVFKPIPVCASSQPPIVARATFSREFESSGEAKEKGYELTEKLDQRFRAAYCGGNYAKIKLYIK